MQGFQICPCKVPVPCSMGHPSIHEPNEIGTSVGPQLEFVYKQI